MACVLFFSCFAARLAALDADQLLLITNANVPQGKTLAEFYAEKRHVPDHRILELNLPTSEEIPAAEYDKQVVPVVRVFLRDHGLERKVICLVTFYGVPIRIGSRVNSPADLDEAKQIHEELKALPDQTEPLVQALEKAVEDFTPDFKPAVGKDLESQSKRTAAAMNSLAAAVNRAPDISTKQKIESEALRIIEPLIGPMGVLQRSLVSSASRPASRPATRPVELYVAYRREIVALEEQTYDPDARKKLRDMVRQGLGPFEYARVLQVQADLFITELTGSALDSELSLLWWQYPRAKWMVNPLNHNSHNARAAAAALMVMRLDGPQSGTVSQIITASLAAEEQGLKGKVVIDSRGMPITDKHGQPDAYGMYDQGLRDLADLLQTKARTKLSIVFDDRPEVLEPHSAKGVAVYMGWYSVDKYVPACDFVPGAVGFHLASFTMVTLRRPDPRCWVRNLQEDGIAATLGAVDEPYLQAFPPADEFFPLLLTGKLTLAEVYWKTVPWSSWRISMIGDPLYTPYKVNPVLAPEDLPAKLRDAFSPVGAATSQPH